MEELRTIITGILVSCTSTMSVCDLDKDYYEHVGERIPFRRLGYATLEACLHDLPNTVQVLGTGRNATVRLIVSQKSAHIDKLVSKQRRSQTKSNPRFGSRPRQPAQSRFNNQSFRSNTNCQYNSQLRTNTPHYYPPTRSGGPGLLPISPLLSVQTFFHNQHVYKPHPKYSLAVKHKPQSDYKPNSKCKLQQYQDDNTRSRLVTEDHTQTTSLVTSTSTTLVTSTLTAESPRLYSSSSPQLPNNDGDTNELASPTASTNSDSRGAIPKKGNTPTLCYDSNDSVFESDIELPDSDSDDIQPNLNVPLRVQENLEKLIKTLPDGIWCGELPELYKEKFGSELDFMEYGYRTLYLMCYDLGKIFHIHRPDNGDFLLFDKSKPMPDHPNLTLKTSGIIAMRKLQPEFPTGPAIIDVEDVIGVEANDYPPEVMKMGDTIAHQFPLSNFKAGDNQFVEVIVGEVYDPSKLWLLLRSRVVELNKLMDEMQTFYTSVTCDIEIPRDMLKVKLYCAAKYNNQEYHRCIIISPINAREKIKVFYIDYGTVNAISPTSIYYLHKKFSNLPAQGIRSRLANIYPPVAHTQWPVTTATRLLQLVSNKPLIAHIYRVDYELQIIDVFLVDTSTDQDLFMNDTLVYEGLARFTSEEQDPLPLDACVFPKVKNVHLYPTFHELERGQVPGAADVIRLLDNGMDVDRLSKYFIEVNSPDDIAIFSARLEYNLPLGETDFACSAAALETQSKHNTRRSFDDMEATSWTPLNMSFSDVRPKSTVGFSPDEVQSFTSKCMDWNQMCEKEVDWRSVEELDLCVVPESSLAHSMSSINLDQIITSKPTLKPPPGFEGVQPNFQFSATINLAPDDTTLLAQARNVRGNNPAASMQLVFANQPCGDVQKMQKHQMLSQQTNFMTEQKSQQQLFNDFAAQTQMLSYSQHHSPWSPQVLQEQTPVPPRTSFNHPPLTQDQLNYIFNALGLPLDTSMEQLREVVYDQLIKGNKELFQYLHTIIATIDLNYATLLSMTFEILSTRPPTELADTVKFTVRNLLLLLNNYQMISVFTKARELAMSKQQVPNNLNFGETDALVQSMALSSISSEDEKQKSTFRKRVVQTDLNERKICVINWQGDAYVCLDEVVQFTPHKSATIESIRKIVVLQNPSISIEHIPLTEDEDLQKELMKFKVCGPSLHVIPVGVIPKLMSLLCTKDPFQNYEEFLTKVNINSDLWL